MRRAHHLDTVAGKLRFAFKYITVLNEKTPKGEAKGYLQAIVYLAPHTLGGGKNLCAHSTAACRAGCLYTAGRGRTPRVEQARLRRTHLYLNDRDAFFDELIGELVRVQAEADKHGLILAIRLNGTSDVLFEREIIDGRTLFDFFPRAVWFDYTRTPSAHRRVPAAWHLTFSLADDPLSYAIDHLMAGRSVAAVVPLAEKEAAPDWFALGGIEVQVIDGETDDLRFLDPSPSLVLLKPKGRLLKPGNPMVRSGLIHGLIQAGKMSA